MFWYFGPETCGVLAPQPGIELGLLSLEGKVLTSGPQGSPVSGFLYVFPWCAIAPQKG